MTDCLIVFWCTDILYDVVHRYMTQGDDLCSPILTIGPIWTQYFRCHDVDGKVGGDWMREDGEAARCAMDGGRLGVGSWSV